MLESGVFNVDVLQQNCKVKRTYKKCVDGVLCNPEPEFDTVERCVICNKYL